MFRDQAHAEEVMGCSVFPAPLGNVTKLKSDGTLKHRLIQDLKANSVNKAVSLTERQVLPRGVDHARDIAILQESRRDGEEVSVLIIDFKNAFLSVPLHASERRFNCARIPEGISRGREPMDDDEPLEGKFVVWQVLGFGGKPNPLLFARVASVAIRTGQALFGASRKSEHALVRCQLYVDDPAVTVCGDAASTESAMDILILWWLCLGVPMAWKKGS